MYYLTLVFGLVLWISVCVVYARSRIASAFHPISFYAFFHGLIFVLRPILAYAQDFDAIYRAFEFNPTEQVKIQALLVSDLGFVVFVAVAAYAARTPIFQLGVTAEVPITPSRLRRLRVGLIGTTLICLPPGIISLANAIAIRHLGTSTMITDAATGYAVNTSGNGYFDSAAILLSTLTVMIAWVWRFQPLALLPFGIYIVAQSSTGGRWPFVMATGSLLLLYLIDRRQHWPTPRVILAGLIVTAFFSSVGLDRGASVRALFTGQKAEVVVDNIRPFEGEDFANMEMNEYIISIIPYKTRSFDYFADNLVLFTGPIPRKLWPDKPIGSPIQFYSIFDYGTPVGMTYSLPGEGWAQLGWLGVIIWCGLGGIVVARIYELYVKGSRTVVHTLLYCMFAPLTLILYRDGSLPEIIMLSGFVELPVLMWALFTRLLAKRRAPLGRQGPGPFSSRSVQSVVTTEKPSASR